MASSFFSQIPVIVHVLTKLRPERILDVGKGFGKYGFLIHEYWGIDDSRRPDPSRTLAEQSRVEIDAVDCNEAYLWPHLGQFYKNIYMGRIEDIYETLPRYDAILMADVIEHLEKPAGQKILRYFLDQGSTLVVSTPARFFQQECFESPYERHVSYWAPKDFCFPGYFRDYQNVDSGRVFVLSGRKVDIRGFGNGFIKKARRIARVLRNKILPQFS